MNQNIDLAEMFFCFLYHLFDLIILGQSGRRGLDRFITGRVARHVENKAKVPVLVAKRPLMCEEPFTKRDAFAAVSVTSAVVLILFFLSMVLK